MNDNVINFGDWKNGDLVELLEMLTEEARVGRIKGIALTAAVDYGVVGTAYSGVDEYCTTLIGGVSMLDYRLKREQVETDRDDLK